MRFCRRYTCCSSLRQGRCAQSSLGRHAPGALVSPMLLAPLLSALPCLRQPILGLSPRHSLLRQSSPRRVGGLVTYSPVCAGENSCGVPPFRYVVLRCGRSALSAGFGGSEYRSRPYTPAPSRVLLDQACSCNPRWL